VASICKLSCLCCAEVTPQTAVREVLGSIPGSSKDIYVCSSVLFVFCFNVFVQNIIIYMTFWHSFRNFISFSILNILLTLWPIISVSRYRASIFKPHCKKVFSIILCYSGFTIRCRTKPQWRTCFWTFTYRCTFRFKNTLFPCEPNK